jgi:hypothetical protein
MYRVVITNPNSVYVGITAEFPTLEAAGRYVAQYLVENTRGPFTVEIAYDPEA